MNDTFALSNNPAPKKPCHAQPSDKMRQKVLFAGLDCLSGQMDLFPTDGQPPDDEQAADRGPDSPGANSAS